MSKLKFTAFMAILFVVAFLVGFFLPVLKDAASFKKLNKANVGESCEEIPAEPAETCQIPGEIPDQIIAERAVQNCLHKTSGADYAYENAMTLLQTEREMKFPSAVRGFSLASACIESGFQSGALGDRSFSKDKKTPMAVGIFQMWPWYARHYKIDRKDVKSAATAWMDHIKSQKSYVDRVCKPKNEEDAWRLALVHGIRSGKKGGRCKENTSHWVRYKKMNLLVYDNI